MNTKIITMTALLGAFLFSGSASAWSEHVSSHTHDKVVRIVETVVPHTHPKPSAWHSHPENGLTNDTYHNHPNGNNYHVHNYGAGGHTHGGYSYAICPYVH